jgi:hypothetical protein
MSQRTIVEFNHDLAFRIDEDPEGFLRAVRHMLNSGANQSEGYIVDALNRFGVRTTPTHHHSTKAEVVLTTDGGFEFHRTRFS